MTGSLRRLRLPALLLVVLLLVVLLPGAGVPVAPAARAQSDAPAGAPATGALPTGNVIFFHPDGSGLNGWNAARAYWYGPDALLNWDQLAELALYRGHMLDGLVGSSNGGATTHAFGYKVQHEGSFGRDGGLQYNDDDELVSEGRPIDALSGAPGSILREAAAAGMPVGIVNDGDLPEPGTGVFLAEVADRTLEEEIARQFLDGRPGFEGEPLPAVLLGGGEGFFLPSTAPACGDTVTLDCYVHVDQISGEGPLRSDDRNLLREAADLGYTILRTRADFEALWARLQAEPDYAPSVLGLFARDDLFNDAPEELLLALRLVDNEQAGTRAGRLLIWGSPPGTPGFNPPSAFEMNALALEILARRSAAAGAPFALISEVESTDNMANHGNAIGVLRALKVADDTIGLFRSFVAEHPNTLLLTAADSDAGGLQLFSPPPLDDDLVSAEVVNPTGFGLNRGLALDGIEGQETAPFVAAPDAFGVEWPFAIGWAGTSDVAGAMVARAEGLNAELLRSEFRTGLDNSDIYRLLYATLFGEWLPASSGQPAPDRAE